MSASVPQLDPERLVAARVGRFLSPQEAALRVGCSSNSWRNWEEGRNQPRPAFLRAVAEVLGVDPFDLCVPGTVPRASLAAVGVTERRWTRRIAAR
ncbi:helix-turn-helix domain-containing protein [Streptomyces sp. NPDC056144]|uniref:helix-turn-helix domain-containing protein n=1 Tax=unclassified Streptomyces TaxID=2593676 RepID=UPI0035E2DAB4